MPTTTYDSVIKAVMVKYRSLDPTVFPGGVIPGIYLDAAIDSETNTEVRVPYVIIRDDSEIPTWSAATSDASFTGGFTLEIWYEKLEDADSCLKAVLWNGVDPLLKQGLALSNVDDLLTRPLLMPPIGLWPGKAVRNLFQSKNFNNSLVYRLTQVFRVQLYQQTTYPPP